MLRTLIVISSAIALSGCTGALAPRYEQVGAPVAVSDTHSVLYTDSSRRGLHTFEGPADSNRYRVCLEPSPDSGVDVGDAFAIGGIDTTRQRPVRGEDGRVVSAGIQGARLGSSLPTFTMNDDGTLTQSTSASAQLINSNTSRNSETINREASIEVFRDTLAQACFAFAQGAISAEEYEAFLRAASGGALAMVAMDTINNTLAAPNGSSDEVVAQTNVTIAEIQSNLAQIALMGLLLTDTNAATEVNSIYLEIARAKAELLQVQIEQQRAAIAQVNAETERYLLKSQPQICAIGADGGHSRTTS